MATRIQWIEFDHACEGCGGGLQLTSLALRDPEQAKRVGIAGL
jgi:hypothetical protein